MTKLGFLGVGLGAYLIDVAVFSVLYSMTIDFYLIANIAGKLAAFLSAFWLLRYIGSAKESVAARGRAYSALIVMNIFLATCLLFVSVDLIKMPTYFAKLGADAIVILMSVVIGRYVVKNMQYAD
jgi:putative flippase GtrA